MTTTIDHSALQQDMPQIRPSLQNAVGLGSRTVLVAGAAAVGAGVALALSPSTTSGLVGAVVVAGAVTSLAANWSTCGMSVAGVVVAPKQPGRKGSSTPVRRLGWHVLGSVATGSVTGAAIGLLGGFALEAVPAAAMLGVWAVLSLAYGLHELGLVSMPTPMRRQQLPRHLRRSMEPWKVSLLFGAIIGPGFLIYIRSSAYYLMALGVAAVGSPALGAALFVLVSLGRCMPSALAIVHTRRGGSMPGFLSLMCVLDRRVQAVTGAVLIGLAVFAGLSI
ncbi:methylamine utilization protein [Rhodococcus sp. Eu-32]|uniref:methylamine utilization protein n=1 Tax=Rhodococcus sp. Eu-32 TaxID=1017319 RepID=UPI000DF41EE7|nr:methylamine utilization protein [Rhodococcus sp. Eu-32]RRQ27490.1 methylamine utilization protein [Rhodococcus sp. Eu-32]